MALAIPAATIRALSAGLVALGYAREELLGHAGLLPNELERPFAVVPDTAFGQIWAAAFAADPSPDLPVRVGLVTPMGAFGLLDHLIASARTVGEGLYTLQLFFRLAAATIRLTIEHQDGDSVGIVNDPPAPGDPISDAWTLALIVGRMCAVADVKIALVDLTLPQGDPARFEEHFGAPVRLGRSLSRLYLGDGVWRQPLRTTDTPLHATLRSLAEQAEIRAFIVDPLGDVLRKTIADGMPNGEVAVTELAERVGMPLRTLQRRLADERLTFRQLLDSSRQQRAQELLQEGRLAIAEIAYELGYGEQSAFTRAFKRWTGQTPRAWAAQMQAKAGGE
jgi:AraC-like DNA-binding protein